VFSLGATLVYAATGHPPYQGETVMDILVRLATEPPDLDGLPDELSALVSACLQRVPRDRPTDSAILGGFGSFALSAGAGHVYLPDSAMAVIAEYLVVAEFQHHPRLAEEFVANGAALDGDPGDRDSAGSGTDASGAPVITDVTDGSHTPLPGFESPAALPQAGRPAPAAGPAARSERAADEGTVTPPAQVPQKTRHLSPRRRGLLTRVWPAERALLPLWARALIAVLLVASGTAIGMVARGADPPAAKGSTSGSTAAARNPALGPVIAPPPSCTQRSPGTTPEICVNLPYGDGETGYVIHGSGFQTFTQVTVAITGVGTSPERPTTDMQGTFSYVIDQGHQFFRGEIPAGLYHVVATESGGRSATATFRVNPPAPGGPPPGPP
jgi:hypothetical protein